MTELLKNGTPFVWSEKCEASFQELKSKLTTTPILTLPDVQKDFVVYCDASHQGLGCVLMQEGKVVVSLKYFFTQLELNMRQRR